MPGESYLPEFCLMLWDNACYMISLPHQEKKKKKVRKKKHADRKQILNEFL